MMAFCCAAAYGARHHPYGHPGLRPGLDNFAPSALRVPGQPWKYPRPRTGVRPASYQQAASLLRQAGSLLTTLSWLRLKPVSEPRPSLPSARWDALVRFRQRIHRLPDQMPYPGDEGLRLCHCRWSAPGLGTNGFARQYGHAGIFRRTCAGDVIIGDAVTIDE